MRRALLLALVGLAAMQGSAAAAISDEEELWRTSGPGAGAGELGRPFGTASDPVNGHVYVVEQVNSRVSEFTPWGDFVKAFGWDVAPGAVNEQQEVRVRAAEGQFRLSFGANTTPDLPFDASRTAVEAALNALPSISAGGGSVSVEAVPGNTNGTTPFIYVVAFKGSLAGTQVAQLVAADGTTPLSGGAPSTDLLVRTRADGSAAGVGLESCTAESVCRAGIGGAGAGQLDNAQGVAVDAAGNVYVREVGNLRVQKFNPAGGFLLMFGGKVNKTKVEAAAPPAQQNRCPVDPGDVCQAGSAGSGDGEFGASFSPGIALGAGGKLFIGDVERIQRFNLEGEWELSVPVNDDAIGPGTTVHDLAIAPGSGDFYAMVGSPGGTVEDVRILDGATGAEEGKLQAKELKDSEGKAVPATKATTGPLATDPAGNVFARRNNLFLPGAPLASPLLQFDAAHNQVAEFGRTLPGVASGFGTNAIGDLHVASISGQITAFGPPPVDFESAPPVPPEIATQFASSVEPDSATVAAEINPHFFSDTHYYMQYGTGECSKGGCPQEKPPPPGPLLTSKTINAPVRAAGIFLEGLAPGTIYHYRFIAESGGGGPVYGIDPDGPEGPKEASPTEGLEATFITPDPIPPKDKDDCANDLFRGGGAARLPNCRAYEMVSPLDKNNGDIKTLVNLLGFSTRLGQSAEDGNRLTYSSYRAFADPKGAPFSDQLLATRGEKSWESEALDPPQGPAANTNVNILGNNFKDFSADLCMGWLVVAAEPQLDPPRDAPDYPNVYRRDNCDPGKESYAALVGVKPNVGQELFYPEPQGSSADGAAAIFRINDKLTAEAASGPWQAYYAAGGELHLLCVLPNGGPSGGNCSGGTGAQAGGLAQARLGREANVENAISADGKRVYWTDSGSEETGAGQVYLRVNPGQEQSALSGETCTEAQKACTLKVSGLKSSLDSRFLTASPNGAKALFEVSEGPAKGDLYEFNLGGATRLIAGDVLGLAGASEDLSRIYFVSEEALDGEAVAGEPNLYLEEGGGEEVFIATLSETDAVIADVEEDMPVVTARYPIYHTARASADGSALAFTSTASPTGYDNIDLASGRADAEVYLYEAGSEEPVCISCNPSRARPRGRMVVLNINDRALPMAAMLPMATTMLHAPRAVSADGSRVFFNSFDPLLPRDTNGAADVYIWERAPHKAACVDLGAELYVASASGCISLISSGESPEDSEFLDASLTGNDAFFITNSSLLGQDPGLFDVYDARAGGGQPAPPLVAPDCQGETCKPAAAAPSDPTPASSTYVGPGDLNEKAKKKKANKKGKKHKKKQKKKKKQSRKGRAAR